VPVGWVSLASREEFGRIERSPILKRVDEQPVWSIVCFFVRKGHRGSGVARAMLDGAVSFARERGATIAEGYPVDTAGGRKDNAAMYHGSLGLFEDAGFEVVVRRKDTRPIVRSALSGG
jgi:GNAT superfamily N-acetyltransferase